MQSSRTANLSFRRLRHLAAAGLLTLALAGCATNDSAQPDIYADDNDPIETINRFTFAFNGAIDFFVLQPAAATYRFIVPDPVQNSVTNALRNLQSPVILANDLFQGEFGRAETTTMRFVINSTVGVLGLFDVAEDWGYPRHDEDFGQTLAVWGVPNGPYLVLPVLGPSTLRDAVGLGVDSLLDPYGYILEYATGLSDDTIFYILLGRRALEGIDARARNFELIENLKADSVDYYSRVRSLYLQNRQSEILNGAEEEIPLPVFDENLLDE